jgi:hypothetical protein
MGREHFDGNEASLFEVQGQLRERICMHGGEMGCPSRMVGILILGNTARSSRSGAIDGRHACT